MAFSNRYFVPFHLADPAGILFFGQTFVLAHQTYEQFVIQILAFPWEWWFQNPDWIVPIKHTEAEYNKPILAGQFCNIEMQLLEIRKSSFRSNYQFFQNNEECCTVKITHVFCNRATKKADKIPEGIRSSLEATLHGV